MGWFMEYMKTAPKKICDDKYITKWHAAANDVIEEEKD